MINVYTDTDLLLILENLGAEMLLNKLFVVCHFITIKLYDPKNIFALLMI